MNKARKKTYKRGTAKRLARESLILSSTRFVSSRVVRFFETGLASPLLSSVRTVDRFARDKVTGPLFKKLELRKKFFMPARNAVASLFSRSPLMKKLANLRMALLNTSVRSVGIFLLTFGVYSTAIFLLKRYISSTLGEANPDDLSVAALTVIIGLLFTMFGDKSILASLGNGRIIGSMLSGSLGVNESTLDRQSSSPPTTAVGISFLLGSMLGVLTLFVTPAAILLYILAATVLLAILHMPEFGLLLSVATLSFLPLEYIAAISATTLVSYLFKCLRLKRNFRFGSSDAIMLLVFIILFISFLVSGEGMIRGELYVLGFASMYFAGRNMLCTERLLYQTFNALCNGLCVGMALYILGEYAAYIPHADFRSAAMFVSGGTLEPEMLAMLVAVTLPFVFSSYSAFGTEQPELLFVLLAVGCAIVTDSFLFCAMILCSFFVYVASVFKAPFGALLGAAVVLPPAFLLLSDITSSSAIIMFGASACDPALAMGESVVYTNSWSALGGIGSIIATVLFGVAVLLVLQRIFSCVVRSSSERFSRISGTVAAGTAMILVGSVVFNLFGDLRMILAFCFILGLCGAVYKVSKTVSDDYREV